MLSSSEIKNQAIASLDGKWGASAILIFIYSLISYAFAGGLPNLIVPYEPVSGATMSFVGNTGLSALIAILFLPMSWGMLVTFLEVSRGAQSINYGNLTKGYHDFTRICLTMLLTNIYTILWTFLLIIPGIVKSYSYSMTSFILADRPDLAYNEAIEESMRMMDGHKMRLFILDLTFLGWALLCLLTLGIGFLFLEPYIYTSHAKFYENLLAAEND